jgi:hypothetical protein
MDSEIPITTHSKLPEEVPLVASFHDDRNRLSYYHPRLRSIEGVLTPLTEFLPVEGSFHSYPEIEYRDATRFMQNISTQEAFVRGDYSSGKYEGDTGSKIDSQDPYDIETVVLELLRQLGRGKRYLGGRIAIREWVPHDREVRFFVRDGSVIYGASLDDGDEFPDATAERIAGHFTDLAWSVDFIRHETTGRWYCIDLGLDGLYHTGTEWIAISEHLEEEHSPQQYTDEMPAPERLRHHR